MDRKMRGRLASDRRMERNETERIASIRKHYRAIRRHALRLFRCKRSDPVETTLDAIYELVPLPFCKSITPNIIERWIRNAEHDGLVTHVEGEQARCRMMAGWEEYERKRRH